MDLVLQARTDGQFVLKSVKLLPSIGCVGGGSSCVAEAKPRGEPADASGPVVVGVGHKDPGP